MDIAQISQLISTVGFPIFVAVYMLMKGSADSKSIVDALTELKNAITILNERLDKTNGGN